MKKYKPIYSHYLLIFFFGLILSVLVSAQSKNNHAVDSDLTQAAIIPKPTKIIATHDFFELSDFTVIMVNNKDSAMVEIRNYLANEIKATTNIQPYFELNNMIYSHITLKIQPLDNPSPEAYELSIKPFHITLTANKPEGAFRGIQTLRQLLILQKDNTKNQWVIPSGKIIDAPEYPYRANMLDVSRAFIDMDYVKRHIRFLAYYKFNTLHLHLSDDQGWRIEIKSWPKLTEIGSKTAVDDRPGGFYTQEQYKEIVAYAAAHYITIVPEIDMPGHTNAASVAYPELNGTKEKAKLYTGTKVGFSTFNTHSPTVYRFINDVINEISDMTPGPYMHIGGDEAKATKLNDYIPFINKVEKIVHEHNKTLIGWDEILETDVDTTSIAQVWRPEHITKNLKLAIKKGTKFILSPADRAYLDMKYDSLTTLGYTWAGYISVKKGYNWDPTDYAPKQNILGIDCPLWTETTTGPNDFDYLIFPRLLGYAEIGWSKKENRNWDEYKNRLAKQTAYFEQNNINYYPSPLIDWE